MEAIIHPERFHRLVDEAWYHEFSGWDFHYLEGRMLEGVLPWDYRQILLEKIATVHSLLDIDTGGGEFLSSLAPLPEETYATEGYAPNVPIARSRLQQLGVRVYEIQPEERLPFPDGTFDLVVNRHGGFDAEEVYRVLQPEKSFITQQVGGTNNIRLNELLQHEVYFEFSHWTPQYAVERLKKVGFKIVDLREARPQTIFKDIGAVVYYLKAIPWQVEGFTPDKYLDRLVLIHNWIETEGSLVVTSERFYLEARKST